MLFRSAATELADTGSPLRATTPAEETFNPAKGAASAASACCSNAAAMGLRHTLAVQTTTISGDSGTAG